MERVKREKREGRRKGEKNIFSIPSHTLLLTQPGGTGTRYPCSSVYDDATMQRGRGRERKGEEGEVMKTRAQGHTTIHPTMCCPLLLPTRNVYAVRGLGNLHVERA